MARGWESKGVEEQQAEAHASSTSNKRPRSAEDAEKDRKREGLRLQRQHILQQMEAARNDRYRSTLNAALQDLDAQLAALN